MGVNTGDEGFILLKANTIQLTPELAAQIIDEARRRGLITIGDMIRATGASSNTLKEHFKRLLEQGHLTRHGTGKATWYALP